MQRHQVTAIVGVQQRIKQLIAQTVTGGGGGGSGDVVDDTTPPVVILT